MKKAIVTGGAGFIGWHLVEELLSHGVEVIVVDREENPNAAAIARILPVRVVLCHMEQFHRLPELIPDTDVDVLFHLAWQGVSDSDAANPDVQLGNVTSTLETIRIAKQMGIPTFLGAGSIMELEARVELDKGVPLNNPRYYYKAAKTAAHEFGKALAGSIGVRFLWPLITNTYGVGERSSRMVNTLVRRLLKGESMALSEGKQLYDFVYITDLARALYLIGERGKDGENYMIGSGKVQPLRKYLETVGTVIAPQVKLGFGEIKNNVVELPQAYFNESTLLQDLGFQPEISFEKGIRMLADWLRETEMNG